MTTEDDEFPEFDLEAANRRAMEDINSGNWLTIDEILLKLKDAENEDTEKRKNT